MNESLEIIKHGDILIEDGRITFIGEHYEKEPDSSWDIWDVTNLTILPGIIESHCHIGITEERRGMDGDD